MVDKRLFVVMDLIDTQWNVNMSAYDVSAKMQSDLIDTQWNVNKNEIFGFENA